MNLQSFFDKVIRLNLLATELDIIKHRLIKLDNEINLKEKEKEKELSLLQAALKNKVQVNEQKDNVLSEEKKTIESKLKGVQLNLEQHKKFYDELNQAKSTIYQKPSDYDLIAFKQAFESTSLKIQACEAKRDNLQDDLYHLELKIKNAQTSHAKKNDLDQVLVTAIEMLKSKKRTMEEKEKNPLIDKLKTLCQSLITHDELKLDDKQIAIALKREFDTAELQKFSVALEELAKNSFLENEQKKFILRVLDVKNGLSASHLPSQVLMKTSLNEEKVNNKTDYQLITSSQWIIKELRGYRANKSLRSQENLINEHILIVGKALLEYEHSQESEKADQLKSKCHEALAFILQKILIKDIQENVENNLKPLVVATKDKSKADEDVINHCVNKITLVQKDLAHIQNYETITAKINGINRAKRTVVAEINSADQKLNLEVKKSSNWKNFAKKALELFLPAQIASSIVGFFSDASTKRLQKAHDVVADLNKRLVR